MIQNILGQLDRDVARRGIGRRSESVRGIPQSGRVLGSGIPVRHPIHRAARMPERDHHHKMAARHVGEGEGGVAWPRNRAATMTTTAA